MRGVAIIIGADSRTLLIAIMRHFLFALLAMFAASPARADGIAQEWQLGFQTAATPVMAEIETFHFYLLILITAVSLFVLGLLLWCVIRYNARVNPTPSRRSHNTPLEVIWTLIPCLILFVMAFPSYGLLKRQTHTPPNAQITIKATGHQWYWEYEYPDHAFSFDSNIIPENELKADQVRLLSTDNPVVVPVGVVVRVLITASDVLHAFAVPAFGIKNDAVPGRITETWFRADKAGTYYGQCSELCGTRHAFMPIEIHVVPPSRYDAWIKTMRLEFADLPPSANNEKES